MLICHVINTSQEITKKIDDREEEEKEHLNDKQLNYSLFMFLNPKSGAKSAESLINLDVYQIFFSMILSSIQLIYRSKK